MSWYVPKANVDHTIRGQGTSTLDYSATIPRVVYRSWWIVHISWWIVHISWWIVHISWWVVYISWWIVHISWWVVYKFITTKSSIYIMWTVIPPHIKNHRTKHTIFTQLNLFLKLTVCEGHSKHNERISAPYGDNWFGPGEYIPLLAPVTI